MFIFQLPAFPFGACCALNLHHFFFGRNKEIQKTYKCTSIFATFVLLVWKLDTNKVLFWHHPSLAHDLFIKNQVMCVSIHVNWIVSAFWLKKPKQKSSHIVVSSAVNQNGRLHHSRLGILLPWQATQTQCDTKWQDCINIKSQKYTWTWRKAHTLRYTQTQTHTYTETLNS